MNKTQPGRKQLFMEEDTRSQVAHWQRRVQLLADDVSHLDKVTEFFTSLNLPAPGTMAVMISCLELFGGIFLAIGLLSRLTALALTVNMIMAYVTADREALHSIFSDPDKFYAAAPYTFLIASLIVLIFGIRKQLV